jgi:ATP-dependent Lhr-like helicase
VPPVQERLFEVRADRTEEDALAAVVGGWLECLGPVTVADLAERTALAPSRVEVGLGRLEMRGSALRGHFRRDVDAEEWCDRALLARIHRLTLGRLRREIEPVTAAQLMRFLLRWQHVHRGTQLHGRDGLLEVVGQLQGYELPARSWETHVLPARLARYDGDDLEHLCLAGAVAWGRLRVETPEDPGKARAPGRAAPLAFVLREDMEWLLAASEDDPGELPGDAAAVYEHLRTRGASFAVDVARATSLLPAAVEEALWVLVARGLVTGDGMAGVRRLIERPEEQRRGRRLRMLRGGRARLAPMGRWSLLRPGVRGAAAEPERFARMLLRRWGIVMRELAMRETHLPPWREIVRALRTLEARGEVRGGRFVAGTVGEQFALPQAVEALRALRRTSGDEEGTVISAADPLNLVGIVLPGSRIAPAARDMIAYRDGVVAEVGELGTVRHRLGLGRL